MKLGSGIFGYRIYRTDDERFDAAVEDHTLREAGVIEDDQPTDYSHYAWMADYEKRMTGEFTPDERYQIRLALGLGYVEGDA